MSNKSSRPGDVRSESADHDFSVDGKRVLAEGGRAGG
jgi:hypothetical protein